jgi:hypothetical protein
MGIVDNQAFDVQLITNGRTETRRIAFGDVKSIKLIKTLRPAPMPEKLPLKDLATAIPRGSLVEVRFGRGVEPNRIRGRIGHVADQEISLQVFQSGNIQERTFRFDDLQSMSVVDSLEIVSQPEKVHRAFGYGLAIALTVVGVLALIGGILWATKGGG